LPFTYARPRFLRRLVSRKRSNPPPPDRPVRLPQPRPERRSQRQKSAAKQLLDINTATEDELRALKGVGDIRAANIIRNRPYKGKDELVQKKIIPAAVYAGSRIRSSPSSNKHATKGR